MNVARVEDRGLALLAGIGSGARSIGTAVLAAVEPAWTAAAVRPRSPRARRALGAGAVVSVFCRHVAPAGRKGLVGRYPRRWAQARALAVCPPAYGASTGTR